MHNARGTIIPYIVHNFFREVVLSEFGTVEVYLFTLNRMFHSIVNYVMLASAALYVYEHKPRTQGNVF